MSKVYFSTARMAEFLRLYVPTRSSNGPRILTVMQPATSDSRFNDTYRPWTYQQQNWLIACTVTPIDVRVRFGRNVRGRRQKLGVSQEEFADICGLDRTYMGGIERGERNLSLINIEKIALGFQITLAELFRGV